MSMLNDAKMPSLKDKIDSLAQEKVKKTPEETKGKGRKK